MNINDFTIRTTTFEARHPQRFLLWDRSGEIWTRVAERWPALRAVETQPNSQKFAIDRELEAGVLTDRFYAISADTKPNSELFRSFCNFLIGLIIPGFHIETFSRLGYRLVMAHRFDNQDEAVDAFISTRLLKLPPAGKKTFGVDGAVKLPNVSYRFEDASLGVTLQLFVKQIKLDIAPLFGQPDFERVEVEKYDLVFDCDYYTMAEITVGQFKFDDWVKNAMHIIRRDSGVVLGG